jgi:hypothetical protein
VLYQDSSSCFSSLSCCLDDIDDRLKKIRFKSQKRIEAINQKYKISNDDDHYDLN